MSARPFVIAATLVAVLGGAGAGTAAAGHCRERSSVVGYRRCGSFGSSWANHWSNGLFGLEIGTAYQSLAISPIDQSAIVYNAAGASSTVRVQLAAGSRHAHMIGFRFRDGYRGRYLSFGVEMSPTTSLSGPQTTTMVDGVAMPMAGGGISGFDLAVVVGVHTRVAGMLSVGAELVGGLRSLTLPVYVPAGYTQCAGGGDAKGCEFGADDDRAMLEARVRADVFLNRGLSIGVAAGYDLAASGESIAIQLSLHGMAFDGS